MHDEVVDVRVEQRSTLHCGNLVPARLLPRRLPLGSPTVGPVDESTPARKPPGLSWERWIERQISEAIDRGDFDGLPGAGRPIKDLGARRDEMAWIRDKLRREKAAPPPPPAIQIRIDVDAALASLGSLTTEAEVRSLVEHLNDRIRTVNRTTVIGPPTSLSPMLVDEVVDRWRQLGGGAEREAG